MSVLSLKFDDPSNWWNIPYKNRTWFQRTFGECEKPAWDPKDIKSLPPAKDYIAPYAGHFDSLLQEKRDQIDYLMEKYSGELAFGLPDPRAAIGVLFANIVFFGTLTYLLSFVLPN